MDFLNLKHYKRSILVASGLILAMVALAGLRSNVHESGAKNEISSPSTLLQDIVRMHPQSEEFADAQGLFQVCTVHAQSVPSISHSLLPVLLLTVLPLQYPRLGKTNHLRPNQPFWRNLAISATCQMSYGSTTAASGSATFRTRLPHPLSLSVQFALKLQPPPTHPPLLSALSPPTGTDGD
jgi:hypothetical protein